MLALTSNKKTCLASCLSTQIRNISRCAFSHSPALNRSIDELENYGRHSVTSVESPGRFMQIAAGVFLAANRVVTPVDGALDFAQHGVDPLHSGLLRGLSAGLRWHSSRRQAKIVERVEAAQPIAENAHVAVHTRTRPARDFGLVEARHRIGCGKMRATRTVGRHGDNEWLFPRRTSGHGYRRCARRRGRHRRFRRSHATAERHPGATSPP